MNSKLDPFADFVEHPFNQTSSSPVVILGMRHFGQALDEELAAGDIEVLCIDRREKVVQELSLTFDHVVTADATISEVLKQLGVDEAKRVVTAIDGDVEVSLLTTSAPVDMGASLIWARADNQTYAKTLGQIGVHHAIRPEADTDRHIAHLVGGKVQDFSEFNRDYVVGKVTPSVRCLDKTVAGISQNTPITVVAVQKYGQCLCLALVDGHVAAGDLLIASGAIWQLEALTGE